MALTLAEIENAAFWDQAICLDCGAVQQPGLETTFGEPCEECGSENCASAHFILKAGAFVKAAEEESEADE